jgi:outer membrane protein TolC
MRTLHVFVVVALCTPLAAQAQDGPVLTLGQAVTEALVHNDRMVNQRDSTEQARLSVRLARNTFQPKLVPNISGSFGQTNVSNQSYRVDLLQKFTTGTEIRVGVGTTTSQIPALPGSPTQEDIRFYNADTTFTISQPLLKGFGPAIGRRLLTSAEVRQADASRQQIMAEQSVAVEVAAAYYRVVAQEALVDVARSSVERARRLREASEAKLDAGLVSQLDVFRAQQLVSQAELQFFDAQAAVDDARDHLRFLIGRDSDDAFVVVRDVPRFDAPIEADAAVATALEQRLDLQSILAFADDAERAAAFARNQLLPQVDVNLALTRRETANSLPSSFGLDGFRFATFLTISMPIDRTPAQIEYQNSLIERDRRTREIQTLKRRIGDDVRRVIRQRERMIRNLAASEATVDVARREVEVAQLRYERGLSNNLDVVTAEGNLLSLESRRISALAESAVAHLALRATLGILDPLKDIVEAP